MPQAGTEGGSTVTPGELASVAKLVSSEEEVASLILDTNNLDEFSGKFQMVLNFILDT